MRVCSTEPRCEPVSPSWALKAQDIRSGNFRSRQLESLLVQGQDKLLEFLKDETGRSLSALKHALDEVSLLDEHRLLIACGHDKKLLERIRPFVKSHPRGTPSVARW